MAPGPRPFDIVHVSSAHPWTDNRVHLREAASAAAAGYRTALLAVSDDGRTDVDWDRPDPVTGVYVRRVPRRPRARRVTRSTVQVILAALSSRARVVHLHDPELVWAVPLLRMFGCRVVYDAHEDLPQQVAGKEYLGRLGRVVGSGMAHGVLVAARRASAVVAATPTIAERFPAARTRVVRNVPRLRAADANAIPVAHRPANVVYIGALSRDRGLDVLTALAARVPSGWGVVTAGPVDGSVDRRELDRLVATGDIDHRGVLPSAAARDLLHEARIGLLPLLPTPAYAASLPTKLFEYLAAGLPVIATDVPVWRDLLAGVDCATWVPPGDVDAVVRAIRRYGDDPDLLDAHSAAGRALVARAYRWDDEERVLLDLYRELHRATPFHRHEEI